MAIARGGPTRIRSESVALVIKEHAQSWHPGNFLPFNSVDPNSGHYPNNGLYSSVHPNVGAYSSVPTNVALPYDPQDPNSGLYDNSINPTVHSSVTGARGYGVVANTNA